MSKITVFIDALMACPLVIEDQLTEHSIAVIIDEKEDIHFNIVKGVQSKKAGDVYTYYCYIQHEKIKYCSKAHTINESLQNLKQNVLDGIIYEPYLHLKKKKKEEK